MKEILDIYLQQEEEKIEKADKLRAELDGVWFGILNPRWWRIKNQLHKVVMSFELCDKDYKLRLPIN